MGSITYRLKLPTTYCIHCERPVELGRAYRIHLAKVDRVGESALYSSYKGLVELGRANCIHPAKANRVGESTLLPPGVLVREILTRRNLLCGTSHVAQVSVKWSVMIHECKLLEKRESIEWLRLSFNF